MATGHAREPTVLVVDDEELTLELYAAWFDGRYPVRTTTSGAEALEQLAEDDSIAVVLLDRRMPGMDGVETLEAIRARESDCRVVMVTAVEPDVDALDLDFDGYLVKPMTREEVLDVVDRLVALDAYDSTYQEYYRLVAKAETLERSVPHHELEESDRFAGLLARIEAVEDEIDGTADGVDVEVFWRRLGHVPRSRRGADA